MFSWKTSLGCSACEAEEGVEQQKRKGILDVYSKNIYTKLAQVYVEQIYS